MKKERRDWLQNAQSGIVAEPLGDHLVVVALL
jgi:hypothetical protein